MSCPVTYRDKVYLPHCVAVWICLVLSLPAIHYAHRKLSQRGKGNDANEGLLTPSTSQRDATLRHNASLNAKI